MRVGSGAPPPARRRGALGDSRGARAAWRWGPGSRGVGLSSSRVPTAPWGAPRPAGLRRRLAAGAGGQDAPDPGICVGGVPLRGRRWRPRPGRPSLGAPHLRPGCSLPGRGEPTWRQRRLGPRFWTCFPSRRVGLAPPTARLGRSSPIWRIRGRAVSWAGVTTLGSGVGALVTPNGMG